MPGESEHQSGPPLRRTPPGQFPAPGNSGPVPTLRKEPVSHHYFHLPTQGTLLRSPAHPQLEQTAKPWGPGEHPESWVHPFLPCQGTCFLVLCIWEISGLLFALIFSPTCKNKSLGSPHFSTALRISSHAQISPVPSHRLRRSSINICLVKPPQNALESSVVALSPILQVRKQRLVPSVTETRA